MRAKLKARLGEFRTWDFKREKNTHMQNWIASNIQAFSGIPLPETWRVLITGESWSQEETTWESVLILQQKDLMQLFLEDELDTLRECLRELGKWYAIWETLFSAATIPSHPCKYPAKIHLGVHS